MQNIQWVTLISPDEWYRLRIELAENGFELPYTNGMAENRRTGYRVASNYERPVPGFTVGRLTLNITNPHEVPGDAATRMIGNLFGVSGVFQLI